MSFFNNIASYTPSIRMSLFSRKANLQKNRANQLTYLTNSVLRYVNDVSFLDKIKNPAFYSILFDKFNNINCYKKEEVKEDFSLVGKVYNLVLEPSKEYIELIKQSFNSFDVLYNVTKEAANDKKKLIFSQKILSNALNEKNDNQKILVDLLKSPMYKKYEKNPEDFYSYLILNKEDENVVKNLDELVASGAYEQETYKKILNINKIYFDKSLLDKGFDKQFLLDNYNEQGLFFVKSLIRNGYLNGEVVSQIQSNLLKDIYTTTNQKNYKLRNIIFEFFVFQNSTDKNVETNAQEISEMRDLFNYIDNNKDAKEYVEKLYKNKVNISLKDLNEILRNISAKKLNIFYENSQSIITQTNGYLKEKRVDYLKAYLHDEKFETKNRREQRRIKEQYGWVKKQSIFSKFYDKVENQINILRYKIATSLNPKSKEIMTSSYDRTNNLKAYVTPKVTFIDSQKSNVEIPKKLEPKVVKTEIVEEVKNDVIIKDKKALRAELKEQRKQNILEIASKNLGVKTYAKQQNDFGLYANAMRLSLLPEIFASVSDTRKIDRLVGKQHSNSSNKDALKLYTLINGNNKKLVNYLLKKRNVDNSRMFEVKDIIAIIQKAEAKIEKQKLADKNYKAKDARAYYNKLYEAKIQEYGKVSRSRKVK